MNKKEKEQVISEIKEKLDKASSIYLTDFSGLTVQQTNELRDDFYNAKVEYRVIKNTLIKKALEEAGADSKFAGKSKELTASLKGPTGVVFAYNDPISPARIIKKFFDKGEKPKLKLAIIETEAYDKSRLNELAALQSKPELISSIIGSIHAPISGIVYAINSMIRDLGSIIEEVAKKNSNQ